MTLEAWSTVASIGTFVVIAATAIAALVQLRHLRSSNQIAALTEASRESESERFRKARRFIREELPNLLGDPAFRARLAERELAPEIESVMQVAAIFENLGSYVKFGAIDRQIVIDQWGDTVLDVWRDIEPVVAIQREHSTYIWENFEFLVVLVEDFMVQHPRGSYPAGVRRKRFGEASRALADEAATYRAQIRE